MLIIYGIFWIISTVSIAYFSDTLGFNHILVFFANQLFFGFLSFVCLRIFAFPLSDGTISPKERLDKARNQVKSRFYYIFWGIATVSVVMGQLYVGSGYRVFARSLNRIFDTIEVQVGEDLYRERYY